MQIIIFDDCLPGISLEVSFEHAIQYERKKDAEGEKKNNKRISEAIDQIDEEDEDQPNSKLLKLKQELKNDYGNTFKQIKDQIGGNFKKMEESIYNLQINFDQNKTRNIQYY